MISRSQRRLWMLVVAALVLAVAAGSCGGADEPGSASKSPAADTTQTASTDEGPLPDYGDRRTRDRLVALWARLRADFRAGRMGAVCARIVGFGMTDFPPGPADPGGSCERKLRWFAGRLRRRPPTERLSIGWVRVYEYGIGGVTLVDAQGDQTRVPFEREDGRWGIELGVFDRPETLVAPIEPAGRVTPVVTPRPAATFAPFVRFHPRELWWPLDARHFLDLAIFSWADPRCTPNEEVAIGATRRRYHTNKSVPIVNPRRLAGARAYRYRPRGEGCAGRQSVVYKSTQRTRPYDDGPRPPGLQPASGFVIDLATGMRIGDPLVEPHGPSAVGAPVYYEQRGERVDGAPGLRITYWMLYGFERPLPEAAGARVEHEGDWERISVLLRRGPGGSSYSPVSVRYHVHGRQVDIPWENVRAFADGGGSPRATHPAVFAARGTHEPYASPGTRKLSIGDGGAAFDAVDQVVGCARCPAWRTWRRLLPLRRQPWYGYGGAWGQSNDRRRTGAAGPVLVTGATGRR